MRKLITIALAAALACASPLALAACGNKGGAAGAGASEQGGASQFATLGDVLSADTESMMSTFDDKRYACAFSLDGTWWHVEAALEEGMSDKLNEVWTEDQGKLEELLSPIAVTLAETIDAPTEEEVDAYVGKTGADLVADGFEFMAYGIVVNGDVTDCSASKGSFDYLFTFDGVVADEDTDDPADAVADLTVTSASLQGVSWKVFESE